jgi:hypothetical protein
VKAYLKIAGIVILILVLLAVGVNLVIKNYLSSNNLKSILLPRAEAALGRKVNLDEINVSLFSGIVAKGLSVKEKNGQKDFLKTERFVLSYRLLPLLEKQLVISKIEIVSPAVNIERLRGGRYNFSDITENRPKEASEKTPASEKSEKKGLPISVIADRFFIQNGHITFTDEEKTLPDLNILFDAEFKGGIGQDGSPRLEQGHIGLKEIRVDLKGTEVKVSGKIDMDEKTLRADLHTLIGKDSLDLSATVKDYRSTPDVTANLHAKSLDIQKLMAFGGGKKAPEETPLPKKGTDIEKKAEPSTGGEAKKIKAQGKIAIDEAKYGDYVFKDFRVPYRYANGGVKLEPLESRFLSKGSLKTEGSLKSDLQFAGEDASSIEKTLKGKAEAKLGKGEIKESRIFDTIAFLTNISDLKNPGFDQGLFNIDIKEEKIFLDGWIASPYFKVSPKGWVDFNKRLEMAMELKLSPSMLKGLNKKLASSKFLKDEEGWRVFPFKIRGTTENPSVTLDEEALVKQLGPALRKGIERYLNDKSTGESGTSSKKKGKDLLKEFLGE